ncbi:MAG: UDP-N-acetylmuramate dehydrogenase [Desulfurella sp.]|uniref:UDP-N-acetylmuramate dehydrogenase n=1 Tax=Desulfurella sp. TaxID=1962857 RepID=UPI003CBBC5AD
MQKVEINTCNITSFRQDGVCLLNYIENVYDLDDIETDALIGYGSNILINSKSKLYKLSKNFSYVKIHDNLVKIGGSTGVNFINKILIKENLSGLEFLGGIPASIGGCVRMNAGAFEKSIKDIFELAICFSSDKGIHKIDKDEANFGYRSSNFKGKIILEVELRLKKDNLNYIEKKIRENIKIRISKAPIIRTFGSVFKNPQNQIAGKLIEECGLKGKTVNDAMISKSHANYIINLNKATASDALKLIDIIKNSVYKKFNIELQEEVIIL